MVKYLGGNKAYAQIHDPSLVSGLLQDTFTRAVCLHLPSFAFNDNAISDQPDISPEAIQKYWNDPTDTNQGRKIPGRRIYIAANDYERFNLSDQHGLPLTKESIQYEIKQANLSIDQNKISELFNTISHVVNVFSDIVKERNQTDQFYMRCFQLWAPKGALGRSPSLHIDNTDITGLWYAGRATAKIYTGDIPPTIWRALKNGTNRSGQVLQNFTDEIDQKETMSLLTNSLNICVNQKGRDITKPEAQNKVCPHFSGDIPQHGQAGIALTPQFL